MKMPVAETVKGYANGSGFAAMKEGAEKWNTAIALKSVLF